MTKRFIVFTAAVVLFAASLPAAEDVRNGHYWRKLTHGEKIFYMLGFFDAVQEGVFFLEQAQKALDLSKQIIDRQAPRVKRSDEASEVLANRLLIQAKIKDWTFPAVTLGQFSDGLDSFYNDYRLLHIRITAALTVVALELSGASVKEIEEKKKLLIKFGQ